MTAPISRRRFLSLSLLAATVPLAQACAPAATPSPTSAPAKPTEAPKPAAAPTSAPAAAKPAGPKPKPAVGSKNFTEQLVVGNMVALLLEDAGHQVERKLNLGGTAVVHQAVVSGEVDTYVEYTGTGLIALLKLPPETDSQKVYDTVKKEYEGQFKATWLRPWGFNNTYAVTLRSDRAAELGATKLSDLKDKAASLTFGATQEFATRPDGLPGLQDKYEMKFKEVKAMDPGLMYQAVESKQVDAISAFATDGRIPALKLLSLDDDQRFFPPYFAAPVIRQETLEKDQSIAETLNALAGKIDNTTMAGLNLKVDQDKKEPDEVAGTFLKEQGLIK